MLAAWLGMVFWQAFGKPKQTIFISLWVILVTLTLGYIFLTK
jgi:hypothetical protein